MQIQVLASVVAALPPAQTFAFVTDSPRFPEYFPGNPLIPAVERVEILGDLPQRPGTLRKVGTADGAEMTERVDVFDAPHEHTYTLVDGFRPPGSWLFSSAQGQWLLTPEGAGTRIDWHYRYTLRSPLAWPVAWLVIGVFFRRAMQDCLQRMAADLGR